MVTVIRAQTAADWNEASRLVTAYAASLEIALDFQDFDDECADLEGHYGQPGSVFLLARLEAGFVGCGAIRRWSATACEMKRLYVAPAGQGQGIGRTLATALIAEARRLAYRTMLLDTLPSMRRARELYASLGFREVSPYRFNPVAGTAFLTLDL